MGRKKPKGEPPEERDSPADELGLVSGANVKLEKVAWDWKGMVVRNALNLIDGHKGTGKSSVMASIAVAVCGGKKLPETRTVGPKGACLWFGSEEHFGGSVVSRWKANGGDPRAIHTVHIDSANGVFRVSLPHQEDRFREIVRRVKARCVVIDPYTALGDAGLDTRHEQSSRYYLEALARVAHEEHCTMLLSRHLRKGHAGSLLEHGLGSVAIAAVCRSVLRVERDKQNPASCYIACVAGNHGKADGVVPYVLEEKSDSVFVAKFGARLEKELTQVLEGGEEPDERDKLLDARVLLTAALKGGPVDAKTLIEEAMRNGIGERTLRKAKTEMGVLSKRIAAGKGVAANWQWRMPAKS